MVVNRSSITPEVLENTLRREVFPEIRTVAPARMGKVRTVYDVGGNQLVMMASDNLSVYDVVLQRQVYGKGDNLDAISAHYFTQTGHIIPNHFSRKVGPNTWLTQKAKPILVEMVFRKYLTGSGWKSYAKANGPEKGAEFCGVWLRPGYRENEKLDSVIFTPTAKGVAGDFPIEEFAHLKPETDDPKLTLGIIRKNFIAFGLKRPEDIDFLVDRSFALYEFIHSDLESRGELLADTKWEFGYLPDGKIGLIDECVTPDSSRFWNKGKYVWSPETNKFTVVQGDKQPFRDYAVKLGLDAEDKKAELAAHRMSDEALIDGVIRYGNMRETITGTQMEITTKSRRQAVLEALAGTGFLR